MRAYVPNTVPTFLSTGAPTHTDSPSVLLRRAECDSMHWLMYAQDGNTTPCSPTSLTCTEHVRMQADLRWAFGVLLSRAIRLPGRGDAQVLAPWADMLNHDVGAACHLDWEAAGQGRGQLARGWGAATKVAGAAGVEAEAEAGGLVLRADRDYAPGEQVCECLGGVECAMLVVYAHGDFNERTMQCQPSGPLRQVYGSIRQAVWWGLYPTSSL